ncbi:MAG: hypothetical protein PHH70_03825 [Candidatus Gracilibacteria bacterium]|nr:hypothetical protein [Candidatus Gracilibacteria bacterium]
MLFSDDYLSESDKINRIYKMLRSEQRSRRFWWFIRVLFFGGIIYGFYYLSLPAHADLRKQVNDIVQEKMMEFITPMVGNMVQSLTSNMQIPTGTTSTTPPRKNQSKTPTVAPVITPEMIKAVQDAMQKK